MTKSIIQNSAQKYTFDPYPYNFPHQKPSLSDVVLKYTIPLKAKSYVTHYFVWNESSSVESYRLSDVFIVKNISTFPLTSYLLFYLIFFLGKMAVCYYKNTSSF